MKIEFDDKSYVEMTKSGSNPNNIILTIGAKDYKNPKTLIVNSIEITQEQLQKLLKL